MRSTRYSGKRTPSKKYNPAVIKSHNKKLGHHLNKLEKKKNKESAMTHLLFTNVDDHFDLNLLAQIRERFPQQFLTQDAANVLRLYLNSATSSQYLTNNQRIIYFFCFFLLFWGITNGYSETEIDYNMMENDNVAFLKYLIGNGLSVTKLQDHPEQIGFSLSFLHLAVLHRADKIFQELIQYPEAINLQDSLGNTPLLTLFKEIYHKKNNPVEGHKMAELLLKHGANPNIPDDKQHVTALHYAASVGDLNLIKLLLNYGANVSAVDKDGRLPEEVAANEKVKSYLQDWRDGLNTELFSAIEKDDSNKVKALLKRGASALVIGYTTEQKPTDSVHTAIANFAVNSLKVLLDQKINVNYLDIGRQQTPLFNTIVYYAYLKHDDYQENAEKCRRMIKLLLEQGADPNITSDTSHFKHPIHWAAKIGDIGLIQLLLDHGANVNALSKEGKLPDEIATNNAAKQCLQNWRDKLNKKLIAAIDDNNSEKINKLLKRGAQLTALAETHNPTAPFIHDVKSAEGIEKPTKQANDKKIVKTFPLHYAVINKKHSAVNTLLQFGIDINLQDSEGNTALHYAVYVQEFELVKQLVAAGADTNIINKHSLRASVAAMNVAYQIEKNSGQAVPENIYNITELLLQKSSNITLSEKESELVSAQLKLMKDEKFKELLRKHTGTVSPILVSPILMLSILLTEIGVPILACLYLFSSYQSNRNLEIKRLKENLKSKLNALSNPPGISLKWQELEHGFELFIPDADVGINAQVIEREIYIENLKKSLKILGLTVFESNADKGTKLTLFYFDAKKLGKVAKIREAAFFPAEIATLRELINKDWESTKRLLVITIKKHMDSLNQEVVSVNNPTEYQDDGQKIQKLKLEMKNLLTSLSKLMKEDKPTKALDVYTNVFSILSGNEFLSTVGIEVRQKFVNFIRTYQDYAASLKKEMAHGDVLLAALANLEMELTQALKLDEVNKLQEQLNKLRDTVTEYQNRMKAIPESLDNKWRDIAKKAASRFHISDAQLLKVKNTVQVAAIPEVAKVSPVVADQAIPKESKGSNVEKIKISQNDINKSASNIKCDINNNTVTVAAEGSKKPKAHYLPTNNEADIKAILKIKNLFTTIIGNESQDFAFLGAGFKSTRKEGFFSLTYTYEGHEQLSWLDDKKIDSRIMLQALKHAINTTYGEEIMIIREEKKRTLKIAVIFNTLKQHEGKEGIDPFKTKTNLLRESFKEKINELGGIIDVTHLAQAIKDKGKRKIEAVEPVNESIINNLQLHLEKINILTAMPDNHFVYYLNYLAHTIRLLELLIKQAKGSVKQQIDFTIKRKQELVLDALIKMRNVTRHAYNKIEWTKLRFGLQPLINVLISKQSMLQQLGYENSINFIADDVIMQLNSFCEPYADDLAAKRLKSEITPADVAFYKQQIAEIQKTNLSEQEKYVAKLMLMSLIGEVERTSHSAKKTALNKVGLFSISRRADDDNVSAYKFVYRVLGHRDLDMLFNQLINGLIQNEKVKAELDKLNEGNQEPSPAAFKATFSYA